MPRSTIWTGHRLIVRRERLINSPWGRTLFKFLYVTRDSHLLIKAAWLISIAAAAALLIWYLADRDGASIVRIAAPVGVIVGFVIAHIFWTSAGSRSKEAEELVGEIGIASGQTVLPPELSARIISWRHSGPVDQDNLLEKAYRALWSLARRPFTHISQDSIASVKAGWIAGSIIGTLLVARLLVHLDNASALWVAVISLGFGLMLGRVIWTSSGRQSRQAERLLSWLDEDSTATLTADPVVGSLIRDWRGRRTVILPLDRPSN